MALFVPPTSFEFERSAASSRATSPTRPRKSDKPLRAALSTSKKGKFRHRLLKKRTKHTTSASESSVTGLVCARGPSEDIVQSDGERNVPVDSGNEGASEEDDVVETHEEFIEWLCGKRDVRNEAKPDAVRNEMTPETVKEGATCFRCDIFPTSGKDFNEAEKECKQLVVEAGGTIVTDVEYLGGFMYTLPANFHGAPPLETSDETLLGGYIRITPVAPVTAISPLEPVEPQTNPDRVLDLLSATVPDSSSDYFTAVTPVGDPVLPLAAALTTITIDSESSQITPIPLPSRPSAISTASDDSKQWPRLKDDSVTKRAGDWIKVKAAKHKAKIEEEIRAGADKEVVSESEYEGGVENGALYMDGFNDLAVWMGTGGVSREETASTLS